MPKVELILERYIFVESFFFFSKKQQQLNRVIVFLLLSIVNHSLLFYSFFKEKWSFWAITTFSMIIDFIQTSNMSSKKKQTPFSPRTAIIASKGTADIKPTIRKSYQKHSRRGTKDYEAFDPGRLINIKYLTSAKESADRSLGFAINSMILGRSNSLNISLQQALAFSTPVQLLKESYVLSKHQIQGKRWIQQALVENIQKRALNEFTSRPQIHFNQHIYPIMNLHLHKLRHYQNKIAFLNPSSHRQPTPWKKQLPTTLISVRDRQNSEYSKGRCLDSSQSFQLKKLTECIKEMFNKQRESTFWKGNWLGQSRIEDKLRIIDCDFSSIEHHSKCQLNIEQTKDRWNKEAEENYGLGELRKKYQLQKNSKLRLPEQTQVKLGHKRNPTDATSSRQKLYDQPITPKQNHRSAFVSSQNLPLNSPKVKKQRSNKKDHELNQAYLMNFQKKKKQKPEHRLKQNHSTLKSKTKSKLSRSKSKIKQLKLKAK